MSLQLAINVLEATVAILIAIVLSVVEPICKLFIPKSVRRRDVTGKIALITGAGSGLGRGIAKGLVKRGCIIISFDINQAGNEETKKVIEEMGGKCYIYTVDLCDRKAIYEAANLVKKEIGKVDILINNAGIVTGKELMDCPDEMIQRTFDVNILSYIWTTKAFLPAMMESNSGQIVLLSSIAGFLGISRQTDYSASKYAVRGFEEALSMELTHNGYDGVAVTTVFPYYINTGMFDGTRSRLLSILELDDVAEQVTDGIAMRDREIIIPSVMRYLIGLGRIMTYRGTNLVHKAFGTGEMMLAFKGRQKTE